MSAILLDIVAYEQGYKDWKAVKNIKLLLFERQLNEILQCHVPIAFSLIYVNDFNTILSLTAFSRINRLFSEQTHLFHNSCIFKL